MSESTHKGSLGASRRLKESRAEEVSSSGWGSLIWGQPAEQRGYSADISTGLHQFVLLRGAPTHTLLLRMCVFGLFVTSWPVTWNTRVGEDRCPSAEAPDGGQNPSSISQLQKLLIHPQYTDCIQTGIDFSKTLKFAHIQGLNGCTALNSGPACDGNII